MAVETIPMITWNTTRSLKGSGLAKIPAPTGSLIAFMMQDKLLRMVMAKIVYIP